MDPERALSGRCQSIRKGFPCNNTILENTNKCRGCFEEIKACRQRDTSCSARKKTVSQTFVEEISAIESLSKEAIDSFVFALKQSKRSKRPAKLNARIQLQYELGAKCPYGIAFVLAEQQANAWSFVNGIVRVLQEQEKDEEAEGWDYETSKKWISKNKSEILL